MLDNNANKIWGTKMRLFYQGKKTGKLQLVQMGMSLIFTCVDGILQCKIKQIKYDVLVKPSQIANTSVCKNSSQFKLLDIF